MFHPFEPVVLIIPAAVFYVGTDIALSLYYAGKLEDKNWSQVKSIGIFTRALKRAMKKANESPDRKDFYES